MALGVGFVSSFPGTTPKVAGLGINRAEFAGSRGRPTSRRCRRPTVGDFPSRTFDIYLGRELKHGEVGCFAAGAGERAAGGRRFLVAVWVRGTPRELRCHVLGPSSLLLAEGKNSPMRRARHFFCPVNAVFAVNREPKGTQMALCRRGSGRW